MGAETSLEVQGRRTWGSSSGIPTRCQALPGAWPGILKQKDRVPDVREEPVCVCVCACVLSVVYVYCVCLGVLYVRVCCKNSGDLVVCPIITECYRHTNRQGPGMLEHPTQ